jgi:hypothetical protein
MYIPFVVINTKEIRKRVNMTPPLVPRLAAGLDVQLLWQGAADGALRQRWMRLGRIAVSEI